MAEIHSNETQRDIGNLQAHVLNIREDLDEMRADLKAIRSAFDQARGGVKAIWIGAGLAGSIASTLTTFGLKMLGK